MKQNKKSKYNLSDGEEDDFEFQSLGALSQRDDFEDDMLPDDEEEDGVETAKSKLILEEYQNIHTIVH